MTYPIDMNRVTSRQLYRNRIANLSRSYVGQHIIDEGAESVHEWALSSLETTFANQTLERVARMLFYHGITNARTEAGASPGSHDNLIIPMAEYRTKSGWRRHMINLGWDEVQVPEESPDYFIRVTFGAGTEELDGCNPDFDMPWVTVPLTPNATNDDILDVCEAIVKYINDYNLEMAERA